MDKKNEYWNILTKTTDWVKYSDTKATIFISVYGVLISVIYSNSVAVKTAFDNSQAVLWLGIVAAIFSSISVYFFFRCINPSLKNPNPTSIIYFGHIQEKFSNHNAYKEFCDKTMNSDDAYEIQLTEQIHMNSKIAWRKFNDVTLGLRCKQDYLLSKY